MIPILGTFNRRSAQSRSMNSRFGAGNWPPESSQEIARNISINHGPIRYWTATITTANSKAPQTETPLRARYQSPIANTNPYRASKINKDRVKNFIVASRFVESETAPRVNSRRLYYGRTDKGRYV